MPLFQYIDCPDQNWDFETNPDPAVYEPVKSTAPAPVVEADPEEDE